MSRMACGGETEWLVGLAAGQLGAESRASLERHLENCAECRGAAAGQAAVWAALEGWEAAPVSEDFDRRLYRKIGREAAWRDHALRGWRLAFARAMPLAAAAGIAVMAVFLAGRPVAVEPLPRAATFEAQPLGPQQVQEAIEDFDFLRDVDALASADPTL